MNDRTTNADASGTIYWWRPAALREDAPSCDTPAPRPGDPCPACGQAALAYDAQFILACPACGHAVAAGAFT